MSLAFDLNPKAKSAGSEFIKARKAEVAFARQLRKVAKHVGDLVNGFDPDDPIGMAHVQDALRRYADILKPWATAVSGRMIAEVAARDRIAWAKASAHMGRALRTEIETAPTGQAMRAMLDLQVRLITSLPLEAAERVHDLTLQGIAEGARSKELAAKIFETGNVTKARANTIARTETARTAATLTQVRAQHVGSTDFIWRTAEDSDVRPSHRALNGKTFRWDQPPECDPGINALPGCVFNCRCYAEPVIPE